MTGEQATAAFNAAMALVKVGKFAEARAIELLPTDRIVIERHIAKEQAKSLPA